MKTLLIDTICVGLGSMLGGICRFLISKLLTQTVNSSFPWGTLVINLIGCLLIGLLYGYLNRTGAMSTPIRIFLTIGFCGGFTTFSTFMNENYILLANSQPLTFLLYTGSSLIGGFLLLIAGYQLFRVF